MINKILLADSGTGHSEEMLRMLLDIPGLKHASVSILHVVPAQLSPEDLAVKMEEGGKLLGEAVQKLHLDPSRVNSILRQGDAKTVVCEVADELNVDLIIMGSRGLKRLQSILANSVSQYVFQLAQRPMLLVKDDIYVKRVNRVMVALDKTGSSQEAARIAQFLARDVKGGELILTHVATTGKPPANAEEDPVLAAPLKAARQLGINARAISISGSRPGQDICNLADENRVDLLVMGSPDRRPTIAKGLPDLDRLMGGSISDYVRVYANCPVLLVRTAAA
jgi:nucleotide-binding universal stress UspA family protein